jgi:hypothetical protein
MPKIQNWTLEIADIKTIYLATKHAGYEINIIAQPNNQSTIAVIKNGKIKKKLDLTISLQDFLMRYEQTQTILQDFLDSLK